jgi:serine/threonine protein kinase
MSEHTPDLEAIRRSFNAQQTLGSDICLTDRDALGQGAQGFVYHSLRQDGEQYALKVHRLADGVAPDIAQKSLEAFQREGEWLQNFDHPNIIKVFRTGMHEYQSPARGGRIVSVPYMLMEYAADGSIADRVERQGLLPVDEAALVIMQATQGMRYAHGESGVEPTNTVHSLTHGDLKPGNIMVHNRVAKVGDFGIARGGHSGEETMTKTQFHAFSAPYASARQISTGRVFFEDDIYSLGVTAYELLTGTRPINPEHKTEAGYAFAHATAYVPPMERLTPEGKVDQVVYELNDPVLGALQRKPDDPTHRYATMGDWQADVKEALERGRAKAARATTHIILHGETTWPVKAEEFLQAELPAEKATEPVVAVEPETEIVPNANSGETRKFRVPLSRRKILWGLGGLAVTVGSGVLLNKFGGINTETPAERAEREKLDQERQAIAGFAYEVLDFLDHSGRPNDTRRALRELIPYDPKGIASRIEKIGVNLNDTDAALFASYLVPYNPDATTKYMQAELNSQSYQQALMVAIRLAAFSRTPAGKDGNWEDEVQKVRNAINHSSLSIEERQNAEKALNAALNPDSPSAVKALQDFGSPQYDAWFAEILGAALAPHNTQALTAELNARIESINRTKDSMDEGAYDRAYDQIEALGRSLTPYAPDAVAQSIARMDTSGDSINRTYYAQMGLAVGLAPYNPDATVAYIKDGSEDPNKWQTHTWNMTATIALTKANPDFVKTMRSQINNPPYMQWIDAGLDPLDSSARGKALEVLPTANGLYMSETKYILDALLRSRQPKVQ